MKVLPEGLVLDVVPANPDSQPQPPAGQKFNISCLARHERRLALRKYQDPRGETDSLGDGSQMSKHHEWVVEGVVFGIGAHQFGCSIGVDGPKHMFVSEEVVEAQFLRRSPKGPNSGGISSKFDLRVNDANVHETQLLTRTSCGA